LTLNQHKKLLNVSKQIAQHQQIRPLSTEEMKVAVPKTGGTNASSYFLVCTLLTLLYSYPGNHIVCCTQLINHPKELLGAKKAPWKNNTLTKPAKISQEHAHKAQGQPKTSLRDITQTNPTYAMGCFLKIKHWGKKKENNKL
jgi:hypothetical protein